MNSYVIAQEWGYGMAGKSVNLSRSLDKIIAYHNYDQFQWRETLLDTFYTISQPPYPPY